MRKHLGGHIIMIYFWVRVVFLLLILKIEFSTMSSPKFGWIDNSLSSMEALNAFSLECRHIQADPLYQTISTYAYRLLLNILAMFGINRISYDRVYLRGV